MLLQHAVAGSMDKGRRRREVEERQKKKKKDVN